MIAAAGSAQPGVDQNRTDAQGLKQGAWSKTWPSTGQPRYAGQFKDDIPVGVFNYYDEEGVLTSTMNFGLSDNSAIGEHFHPDGTLMARGKYIGQTKDSTWNYYGVDGHLRKMENYADGKLHGAMISYFADGSVAEKQNFKVGVQHGTWEQYFQDGKPRLQGEMVNGEAQGVMTFYYPNGKREIQGRYENGLRDGAWYYYHDDGSVQLQMLFEDGELVRTKRENGVFKDYYPDDRLEKEVTWKNGKKNGPFKEYHDNGVWVEQVTQPDPKLGTEGGENERILKGQTLKREGNFVDDRLNGEVKEYDEKGKLIGKQVYQAGELVTGK